MAGRDGAAVIAPLLAGVVAAAAAFLLLSSGSARPVSGAPPEDAGLPDMEQRRLVPSFLHIRAVRP